MTRIQQLLAILFAVSLAGCASQAVVVPPDPPPPSPPSYSEPSDALNALLSRPFDRTRAVDIYYVTNRTPESEKGGCENEAFGVDLVKGLAFGRCRLNVPRNRPIGQVEMAETPRADPHRFFRVLSHESLPRAAFREALSDSSEVDLLVLVHGFNVEFGDAVARAAQIAYDLKFQGPVVLFSWPAGGRGGLFGRPLINRTYDRNQRSAAESIEPAAALLDLLAETGKTIHLGVHSMGHQVMVPALEIAERLSPAMRLGEVILNAPDIPLEDFQSAAPALTRLARRVTVYCSYNDNAIAASEAYNDGRRLGACEQIPGVDMINVGLIDAPAFGVGGLGHGYYASRPILTDVFQILLGIEASKRLFIRQSEPNSTENYYLRN